MAMIENLLAVTCTRWLLDCRRLASFGPCQLPSLLFVLRWLLLDFVIDICASLLQPRSVKWYNALYWTRLPNRGQGNGEGHNLGNPLRTTMWQMVGRKLLIAMSSVWLVVPEQDIAPLSVTTTYHRRHLPAPSPSRRTTRKLAIVNCDKKGGLWLRPSAISNLQ